MSTEKKCPGTCACQQSFINAMRSALDQGVEVRMLLLNPWCQGYGATYGLFAARGQRR